MRNVGCGSTRRSSAGSPEHYADLRRIMVAFDEQTFQEIRMLAIERQTSFAEQVRLLVEWGLEQ
jgi:hypothetical protein